MKLLIPIASLLYLVFGTLAVPYNEQALVLSQEPYGKVNADYLDKTRGVDSMVPCNQHQIRHISIGLGRAQEMLDDSYEDVSGYWHGHSIPHKWFGTWTQARGNRVKEVLGKIKNRGTYEYTFSCSECEDEDPGVVAYVYPDDFPRVTLCPEFWKPKFTTPTERGGALIHELSHFPENGGTDDIKYGEQDCLHLARHHPDKAVENADSYEFFAEEY
ncbi:hypothetical protein FRC09_007086 [Ceratobasidium sp. 395]|nr:hypothetical protein FRC09_007086 [Ceratobasidium sp. 395]